MNSYQFSHKMDGKLNVGWTLSGVVFVKSCLLSKDWIGYDSLIGNYGKVKESSFLYCDMVVDWFCSYVNMKEKEQKREGGWNTCVIGDSVAFELVASQTFVLQNLILTRLSSPITDWWIGQDDATLSPINMFWFIVLWSIHCLEFLAYGKIFLSQHLQPEKWSCIVHHDDLWGLESPCEIQDLEK